MKTKQLLIAAAISVAVCVAGCCARGIDNVAFSPDSKLVAYQESQVWVPLWPLPLWRADHKVCWRTVGPDLGRECSVPIGKSGNLLMHPHEESVAKLAFSPDGRHLAVQQWDRSPEKDSNTCSITIVDVGSQRGWTLDIPRLMWDDRFVWASNDEIIYTESRLKDTQLASATWRQGIHASTASRVACEMPAAQATSPSHAQLLTELRTADPGSNLTGQPDYTLSCDGTWVAKVTTHVLTWQRINVFPTPSAAAKACE